MSQIKIMPCNCKSDFQDREYGKGMRVFNPAGKNGDKFRCTVCGKEINPAAPAPKAKK